MNWAEVISELKSLGYTQPMVAEECGCAQSTVSDLAKGNTEDPRHSTGEALRALLIRARKEAKAKA